MKKTILYLILLFGLQSVAFAQSSVIFANCDTIPGRCDKYYYTEWYDTCPSFLTNGYVDSGIVDEYVLWSPMCGSAVWAKWNYTPKRMAVKGLMAMVDMYAGGFHFRDSTKLPEYLFLYQVGANDTMILLDSVRWDTVPPHIMKLPQKADSSSYVYCLAYDAYFKSPQYVDSVFYIAGSRNSNYFGPTETDPNSAYTHIPTIYISVEAFRMQNVSYDGPGECKSHQLGKVREYFNSETWWIDGYGGAFGYFLPIVDNHHLNVVSDSLDIGEVSGSGLFPDMSYDTIWAYPKAGFRFSQWNDGNTENPRVICLVQDTTFTAYFVPSEYYRLQLDVNVAEWGSVEGAGYFPEQTPVTITATPSSSQSNFDQWSDGDWHNPRTVILTQDTSFTAIFSYDSVGITTHTNATSDFQIAICPNPVKNRLSLTLSGNTENKYYVTVYNDLGVCLSHQEFTGTHTNITTAGLPSGHYILKINSSTESGTISFIKQ